MGPQIRADYSASLLRLATQKKMIAGMPLAFGEGDTKGRIMNMAKWKKPKLWVSLICVLLCAAVLVACAVNPQTSDAIDDTPTDGSAVVTDKRNWFSMAPSNCYSLPVFFRGRWQRCWTKGLCRCWRHYSWDYPEFQLSDIIALKEEESGAPIGYTSGSSIYGDVNETSLGRQLDALCEQHTFLHRW